MKNQVNMGNQNAQQIGQNPVNQAVETKVNYWAISTLILFFILVFGGFYTFTLSNKSTNSAGIANLRPTDIVPTNTPEPIVSSPTSTNKIDLSAGWKRAENLSLVTFEYPFGWHVSSSWPTDYKGPVTIVLDPEPLNGAPRGGPTTTIMIKDYSGLDNPEAQLAKNIEEAKKNIIDVQETKFDIGATTFYKLEGKFNLYNEMVPILQYHALLKGPNTNNINTHVVQAELTHYRDNEDHKKYAEILDHLVRSIKHKDQK